ncbi:peptide ABC transporter permease [Amycolatopsis sp. MJM2582]|uniref:ABC transporter permease n=1 Tax=Amycolatopsis TaxID=1813 RepID=UPI0005078154|nr:MULTISPECIES: ABC transporter permease [unclassified Amycolatopsis]KFZ76891.1 peptide ABC transporter permease [Amycolatopsis sp. MJM2582]RSN39546.1 ABC transporter permease [Amycolatopsis sp. WAC 04197]
MTTLDLPDVPVRGETARRLWAPILAAALFALVLLAALWPELLAGGSPLATDPVNALRSPSWQHPFGTDQLGRDVYTRVVAGARDSLLVGFGGTALAVLCGGLLGLLAGMGGRIADTVLMRFVDVLLALPGLMLALLVIAVLGKGQSNVLIAIAVSAVPPYARLVRGQVLAVRESGYVEASVGLGLTGMRIVMRHVIPNAISPLMVLATIGTGTAIIHGSSLSFLGLGPAPPDPEWGTLLAEASGYVQVAWWMAVFPGCTVTLTVVATTVLGRYLRARFDRTGQS